MAEPVKLMIVDDSTFFRRIIKKLVETDHRFSIVGEAGNGQEALDQVAVTKPDVLLLDINMPVMDGLKALKHIMIKYPVPTVMLSAFTKPGAKETFDSLKFGAVDVIPKPSKIASDNGDMGKQQQDIIEKTLRAAKVKTQAARYIKFRSKTKAEATKQEGEYNYIFAMGAAEGGFGALLKLVPQLDAGLSASFIVVIHEKQEHVEAFADYLNRYSLIEVRSGCDGDKLSPGVCFLISGDNYVTLHEVSENQHQLHIQGSPFPGRRNAINMLMFSLAENIEDRAAGILLSGAGNDGSEGIAEIARVGGITLAQEPNNCLCQEMVNTAISNGSVFLVGSGNELALKLNMIFNKRQLA